MILSSEFSVLSHCHALGPKHTITNRGKLTKFIHKRSVVIFQQNLHFESLLETSHEKKGKAKEESCRKNAKRALAERDPTFDEAWLRAADREERMRTRERRQH